MSGQLSFDLEGLAQELGVEAGSLIPLFVQFFAEMAEEIVKAEHFLAQRNWPMLKKTVHNIKGVSANLRILDVYQAAAVLDDLLKDGKTATVQIHVYNLIDLLNQAKEEITQAFLAKGLALR